MLVRNVLAPFCLGEDGMTNRHVVQLRTYCEDDIVKLISSPCPIPCLPSLPWGSTTSNADVTKTVYHISSGNIVWIHGGMGPAGDVVSGSLAFFPADTLQGKDSSHCSPQPSDSVVVLGYFCPSNCAHCPKRPP